MSANYLCYDSHWVIERAFEEDQFYNHSGDFITYVITPIRVSLIQKDYINAVRERE